MFKKVEYAVILTKAIWNWSLLSSPWSLLSGALGIAVYFSTLRTKQHSYKDDLRKEGKV